MPVLRSCCVAYYRCAYSPSHLLTAAVMPQWENALVRFALFLLAFRLHSGCPLQASESVKRLP